MTDWWLYRHYDKDGQLLYVGVTTDLRRRTMEHRDWSSWWADVRRITTAHYRDGYGVHRDEMKTIISEKPLHNIAGQYVPRPHAPYDFEADLAREPEVRVPPKMVVVSPVPLSPRSSAAGQIATLLRDRITSGDYAVGDRLPAASSLAALFDVPPYQIDRALRMLRAEGLTSFGAIISLVPGDPRPRKRCEPHSLSWAACDMLDTLRREGVLGAAAIARHRTYPSRGGSYGALAALRADGYVRVCGTGRRNVKYAITDAGLAALDDVWVKGRLSEVSKWSNSRTHEARVDRLEEER